MSIAAPARAGSSGHVITGLSQPAQLEFTDHDLRLGDAPFDDIDNRGGQDSDGEQPLVEADVAMACRVAVEAATRVGLPLSDVWGPALGVGRRLAWLCVSLVPVIVTEHSGHRA